MFCLFIQPYLIDILYIYAFFVSTHDFYTTNWRTYCFIMDNNRLLILKMHQLEMALNLIP